MQRHLQLADTKLSCPLNGWQSPVERLITAYTNFRYFMLNLPTMANNDEFTGTDSNSVGRLLNDTWIIMNISCSCFRQFHLRTGMMDPQNEDSGFV